MDHPINAVTYFQVGFKWLNVNVGSALGHGIGHNLVNRADNRSFTRHVFQVFDVIKVFVTAGNFKLVVVTFGFISIRAVQAFNIGTNLTRQTQQRLDLLTACHE